MKNTPTPLERILENFDEKYAHYVNLGPEIGESSIQTEIKMLITHAYEVGRDETLEQMINNIPHRPKRIKIPTVAGRHFRIGFNAAITAMRESFVAARGEGK